MRTTTRAIQVPSPWIGNLDQELHGCLCAELFGIDGVDQELEEALACPDLPKRLHSDDIVASGVTLQKLKEPCIILLSQPLTE